MTAVADPPSPFYLQSLHTIIDLDDEILKIYA